MTPLPAAPACGMVALAMRTQLLVLLLLLAGCGPSGPEWLKVDVSTQVALTSIHGTSPHDVYAVGKQGLILHYDGTAWRRVDSGVPANLESVFALSPTEVWAVGESGTVLRGNAWGFSKVGQAPSGNHHRVWATGSNQVYVSGNSDTYRYDGASFTQVLQGSYRLSIGSISGSATTGVWMVSGGGELLRGWNDLLQPVDVGVVRDWELVTVASATDVWLWSSDSTVLRFDGLRWDYVSSPLPSSNSLSLRAGWANGPNDVWFCGEQGRIVHFDGQALKLIKEGGFADPDLLSLWGASATDMWAVGEYGLALRRFVTP